MNLYQEPSAHIIFWLYSDYDDVYLRCGVEDDYYTSAEDLSEDYIKRFNATYFIGVFEWSLKGLIRLPDGDRSEPDIIHVLGNREIFVIDVPTAILARYSKMVGYDYLHIHNGLAYSPMRIDKQKIIYIPCHVVGENNIYGDADNKSGEICLCSCVTNKLVNYSIHCREILDEKTLMKTLRDRMFMNINIPDYHSLAIPGIFIKKNEYGRRAYEDIIILF